MASKMGPVIREIREAVITAARRADTRLPDLPTRHSRQLASIRRQVAARDRYDGGSNGGRPNGSPHRPGDTPAGTRPYAGPRRNKDKGDYGENVTDGYMRERGYDRISHRDGPNGIDGIYANRNGDVIIVEAKYNTSRPGWASDGAGGRNRQMDDGWLTGHYHNHDMNRIRDALMPDRALARAVERLFRNGDVPPVISHVRPDGSVEITVPRFNPDGSLSSNSPLDF